MSATGFTMTSETMTIAAWVKMKSPQSWAGIAFSRAAGGRVNGLNVDGNRVKYHWNDSSATWGFSGGPTINTDEWTFIGLTIEPEQAKLYARPIPKEDETQEVEMQVATNVTNHTEQVIDELEFGRDTHSAGRKFNGYIRDIYIYDKALTEQEMIELANGGGVDLGAAGRYMSDVGAAANRSNDVLPNQ